MRFLDYLSLRYISLEMTVKMSTPVFKISSSNTYSGLCSGRWFSPQPRPNRHIGHTSAKRPKSSDQRNGSSRY